ncbi:MAG: hypothetical protein ACK55I_33165, partial [bacterium]
MIIPNYDPKKKDKDNTKEEVLHPFFKGISRLLLCAPSGGGKTNLLMHILLSPLIYYDEVIIYSKTIDQDKYVIMPIFIITNNKIVKYEIYKPGVAKYYSTKTSPLSTKARKLHSG